MSDTEAAEAKNAGTRFPFINLEKAVARAQQLFDADQRGREMAIAGAFSVWGYSEKSSGGFQTIAALLMYGLLKDSDGGDSRKVGLTDEALRYFRDEREEERKKLAKDFALNPKLISALWKDWHAEPPADTIARSHLKAGRGLSDQSARSLLAIYKENLAFAEIKSTDKPSETGQVEPEGGQGQDDGQKPPIRPLPKARDTRVMEGERELTTGLLSKDASFRLIVSGSIGVKEIERLIRKLQLDKEILAEPSEETSENDEAAN